MAKSKNTTKNTEQKPTEQPVESVAATKQPAKRKPMPAIRRVSVQYTPRIPAARCPWC